MSDHLTDTHLTSDQRPSLVTRLIDWWLRGPPGHDIDRLSPQELEHMAHDLGLRPDELTRLARRDADAEILLHRRLALLGLTAADAERLGMRRDLERTCGLCGEQAMCKSDLEMRPESEDWRSYCPNCGVLETLEAEVKKSTAAPCCDKP